MNFIFIFIFDFVIISTFFFIVIAIYSGKNNQSTRKFGKIMSWLILAIFFIIIDATIILSALGYRTLGIIGFGLIAFYIVSLIIMVLISNAIKKNRYKKFPKHKEKGKIIAAIMDISKEIRATGREPKYITFYRIKIEYKDNNNDKHSVESMKTYTLEQIAYLNSYKHIPIMVADKYCEIVETDLSNVPETYDDSDLQNIEIDNNGKFSVIDESFSDRSKLTTEQWGAVLCGVIFGLQPFVRGIVANYRPMLIVGVIVLVLTICIIIKCQKMKNALDKGELTFATEFKNAGITNAIDTFYDIVFKYRDNSGRIRMQTERVLGPDYEKIKLVKKLPIKVYKKSAKIDMDRIIENL